MPFCTGGVGEESGDSAKDKKQSEPDKPTATEFHRGAEILQCFNEQQAVPPGKEDGRYCFWKSTTRWVFVPSELFLIPQQRAVFVKDWV